MSIAPPTPPPTTAAEIQDNVQAPSQPQPPHSSTSGPDPYQVAFLGLSQIASQKKWHELVKAAEHVDNVTTGGDHHATRLLVIVPLVLAYLIQDEVSPARYALERLPDNLAKHPLIGMLDTLAKVTQTRSHSKVYTTASGISGLVSHADFFDAQLAGLVSQLVTHFVDAFRLRTFQLLSKAYSSLPLKRAQDYLGVPVDVIISEALTRGWKYDSETKTLYPRASDTPVAAPQASVSSLSTLHFVANSVGVLEA